MQECHEQLEFPRVDLFTTSSIVAREDNLFFLMRKITWLLNE